MQIDLLIQNGHIITLDQEGSIKNVVASSEGKIAGIWTTDEYRSIKNTLELAKNYQTIDLQGKTLIPGFVDTHSHLLMYALNKQQVNCTSPKNKDIDSILKEIERFAVHQNDDSWIIGYGYDDTALLDNRHPTRYDLDKVSTTRPIFIKHISNHFAVANSYALQLANIDDTIADPSGGHLGRDANGVLNGVLYEPNAMDLVFKYAPIPSEEEIMSLLASASDDYIKQGITTCTDAGVGLTVGTKEYELHMKAINSGINKMNMQLMIMYNMLREDGKFANLTAEEVNEIIQKDSKGKARLDSAKLFQDGSIQGLTAALKKPYANAPELVGELIFDQQTFNELVEEFHKRGFRIATHGNGDRAILSIIEAYQNALDNTPKVDHRHRIEHVQTISLEDLEKMKSYNIAASFFINHVYFWGDRHLNIFLGEERAKRIDPLHDAVDLNMLYTLHSDCPITPISPLFSIWCAANRITHAGIVLGEEQKISVLEALKSMTIYGAQLNFGEKEYGTIEIGKRADFAILDEDILTVDSKNIKDINVCGTVINGEIVYSNEVISV